MRRSRRRSASIVSRTPGRRTLSTTGVPSARRARCTCAIEAAAYARVSMSRKSSKGERPSARSSSGRSSSNGTGGTWACSFSSSSIQRGGNRSTRVAMTWPSLTKVGPSSSSAVRTRLAWSSLGESPAAPKLSMRPALRQAGDAVRYTKS